MKIYLASSSENRWLIHCLEQYITDRLKTAGWVHTINLLHDDDDDGFCFVSDWYKKSAGNNRKVIAREDFNAVDAADVVIGVYPYGEGTASEIAYATAAGKDVMFMCHWEDKCDAPLITGTFREYEGGTHDFRSGTPGATKDYALGYLPKMHVKNWFIPNNVGIFPVIQLLHYFRYWKIANLRAELDAVNARQATLVEVKPGIFEPRQRVKEIGKGGRSGVVISAENQRIRVRFDGPGGIEVLVNPVHLEHEKVQINEQADS